MLEENMSSKGSSGVDNVSSEGLDSNGGCYPAYSNKHLAHCNRESVNKFKGIMPQQNLPLQTNIQICLGTVRSGKYPEMAYDNAAIQLRCGGSHQNFPWTNVIVKGPNFQIQSGQETVLEIVRGGSCQPRFQGPHGDNYGNTESGDYGLNLSSAMQKRGDFSTKLLFRKMLTPSDVGRLNRIVIPKKYATECFPEMSRRMEEDAKAGVLTEVRVDFFDKTMRSWRFRYCYWKSSQSYVFTRGWTRFVKDKNLKVNDVVAFYLCEVQREGRTVNKFFMIDPVRGEDSSGSGSCSIISSVIEVADEHNIGLNQPEMLSTSIFGGSYHNNNVGLRPEMGGSAFEGVDRHRHHVELKPEVCSDVEKRIGREVLDSDPPSDIERKGFRLFGVQIN